MKRIVYTLILITILALVCWLPASLVAGGAGGGSQSAIVTVTAKPATGTTDVSNSVDANGVFTQQVTAIPSDGRCQLNINAGITGLTKDGQPLSEISIMPVLAPPPPPENSNIIGLVYNFEPDGATFNPPISLTFTYDESLIPAGIAEENLVLAMWDAASGQWVELAGCVVNPETNTVTGLISSFTQFTTLAYTPAPPPPPAGGGGGGGFRPPTPLITDQGVFTRQVIFQSDDRVITLSFDEGTVGLTEQGDPLTKAYTVAMSAIYIKVMEDPPPPPEDARIIGLVYDFGPEGATFDPPISLTFTYDQSLIPEGISEENLVLARWDAASGQWVPLGVFIVAPEINTITGLVSHFTPFTVLAYSRPPAFAAFTARELLVIPTEVDIGERVNIIISLANTGGQSGSYEVILKINGLVEASKEITLAAGDSELVTFDTVKNTADTYSVEVAGLTGAFTVKAKPVAPPPLPPPPTPTPPVTPPPSNLPIIGGIIAAITLAMAGLIYVFLIHRRYKYAAVTYPAEVEGPAAPLTAVAVPPTVVPPPPKPISYPAVGRIMAAVAVAVVSGVGSLVKATGRVMATGAVAVVSGVGSLAKATGRVMAAGAVTTVGGVGSLVKATGRVMATVAVATVGGVGSLVKATGRFMAIVAVAVVSGAGSLVKATGRVMATVAIAIGGGVGLLVNVTGRVLATVATAIVSRTRFMVSKREVVGRVLATVATAIVSRTRFMVSKREVVGRVLATVATAMVSWTRFLVNTTGRFMAAVATAVVSWTRFMVSKREVVGRVLTAVAIATVGRVGSLAKATGRVIAIVAVAIVSWTRFMVSKREVIGRVLAAVAVTTVGRVGSLAKATGRVIAIVAVAVVSRTRLLVSKREVVGRVLAAVATTTVGGVGYLAKATGRVIAIVAVAIGGGVGLLVNVTGRVLATVAAAIVSWTRFMVNTTGRFMATVAAAIVKWVRFLLSKWKPKKD